MNNHISKVTELLILVTNFTNFAVTLFNKSGQVGSISTNRARGGPVSKRGVAFEEIGSRSNNRERGESPPQEV